MEISEIRMSESLFEFRKTRLHVEKNNYYLTNKLRNYL